MGYQEEKNLNASDELIIQMDKETTSPKHTYKKYETERTVTAIPSYVSPVHFENHENLQNKHIETVAVVGAGPAGVSDYISYFIVALINHFAYLAAHSKMAEGRRLKSKDFRAKPRFGWYLVCSFHEGSPKQHPKIINSID